ncbi:MAG: tryptophan halogenase, partial [Xanthomonadales bacterium]|nr:tryptophan halogenase [Xanthomonadales bacterium]
MSRPGPVSKVVIVGGGLDGWSAAAALAQAFPRQGLEISVVSGHVPDTPVTAQTAPVSQVFHQRLGIDEPAMMRACDATFSLGTRFRDWVRDGHDYFQPIGPHGASIEFVHFHNFANKARQAGDETPFNDYSLCAVAARKGKFSHPSPDRNSILSTLFYAHHVKLDAYAGLMRELALNAGVSEIGARVESVVSGDGEARIEALRLEGGDQLTADLFLDCSGPGAVLINALDTDFEDWGGLLPADRLVTAMGPGTEVEPMTTVTGLEHGWHQRMPLQGGTGHCLVCRADDQGDEEALAAFREAAGDGPASSARLSTVRAGRQAHAWVGNCVALGSASVALPPLEFAQLALLQTAVMRLITLFPDRDCSPHIASEFNE